MRYWIVRSEADLQQLQRAAPELADLRIEPASDLVFPLLIERWQGGMAWSGQIELSSALAADWEPA